MLFSREISFIFQAVEMSVWIDEDYDVNITFGFTGPSTYPFEAIYLKYVRRKDSISFDGLLTEGHDVFTAKLQDHHTFYFEFGIPSATT